MNDLTTFYIVRHATTTWNEKRLIQGHKDTLLSETGLIEAKELAKKLKDIKFDYVFSSDLLRAQRTAEIIAMEHKLTVKTTKLLRERNFGHLEGVPSGSFKEWDEILRKLSHQERYTYKLTDEIESDEEIVNRLLTFLREIAAGSPGKTVLVVSHGGIMRATLIKVGFATYDNMLHGAVKNNGFIKLQTDGSDISIKEVSGIQFTN